MPTEINHQAFISHSTFTYSNSRRLLSLQKSAKYCPIFTILVSIERLQNVSFIKNISTFVQPAFLDSPADLENNCLHFNFLT